LIFHHLRLIASFKLLSSANNIVKKLSEAKIKKSKQIKKDVEENINDDELTRLDRLKTGRRNFS